MERACPIDVSLKVELNTSRALILRDNMSWFLLIVLPVIQPLETTLKMSFFLFLFSHGCE